MSNHIETSSNSQVYSPDSLTMAQMLSRFIMGQASAKSLNATINSNSTNNNSDKKSDNLTLIAGSPFSPQIMPKKICKPPSSKKFAHPCMCGQSSHHKSLNIQSTNNFTAMLPPAAYTAPLYLYDPATKKCLPTSRSRDMLLKECRANVAGSHSLPHHYQRYWPCGYDDLVCDIKRSRCVCKPPLHLYYESNFTSFGCIRAFNNSDVPISCKSGHVYNVISKECQKPFDVNELPPPYTAGLSATQFSFVTIVLIWILLLMLIMTAKFRKLRDTTLFNANSSERRTGRASARRNQNQSASAWLHPFMAAVNGHHLVQTRTDLRRHSMDDAGAFDDTDFFLRDPQRRHNELFSGSAGSQQSLNNPPPKFEEIYPSCTAEPRVNIQPPPNEDLPTYDEAMKLNNTVPPTTTIDHNHRKR